MIEQINELNYTRFNHGGTTCETNSRKHAAHTHIIHVLTNIERERGEGEGETRGEKGVEKLQKFPSQAETKLKT